MLTSAAYRTRLAALAPRILAVTISKAKSLAEIKKRLSRHFSSSRDGYKIPDSERHRFEGFMQGAVFMGIVTNTELTAIME